MQAATVVVRLKREKGVVTQGCDVYIGRACLRGGWTLPRSKWANPFPAQKHGTTVHANNQYEEYLLARPDLLADLHELRGKILGCWCKPKACHGDVLARLANALPE